MHIILGASGRVGSGIVAHLRKKGDSVKGIIRDEKKAPLLEKLGAKTAIADANDLPALVAAFQDGSTLFAITPETGHERNVLGETSDILENYRKALANSPIKKVVGLSSIGAQYESGTGNLVMSYLLEHAFTAMPVKQVFVRPAYYFSNWLMYMDTVRETGVLPTFFPVDLSIPMVAPEEVAAFTADVIHKEDEDGVIYELTGPASYSSNDVAKAFTAALGKEVKAVQIPRADWENTLRGIGFTTDAIRNFVEMTQAVISGKAIPQKEGTVQVELKATLSTYIQEHIPAQQLIVPPVAKTKTRKKTASQKAA
ncbi:NmrA family NAD(P)-binding protein [Chitinophaga agri]|uniref:NmrA family NAD(P)-binding protein n=1 Tax=Chitinophaga agri TaxID=2703787 RepID=A0A6B9ZGD9_9BACT|nr:NmrA family NAD(P)-binding protein [Chitinophaga agri]QHS60165.1 NmrA family NAD(P)-binding protein [Chitinophaga agri]